MNVYCATQGIVLALRDQGEANRMVTLYTERFGKITLLARGLRRATSKLRGHLAVGSLARIAFVEGKEINHLVDAESLSALDSSVSWWMQRACSFLDQLLAEGQRDETLWDLVGTCQFHSDTDLLSFESSALKILGFLPPDTVPSKNTIRVALAQNHITLY